MKFDAIIFDFDGVILESEYAGNRHLAETLTSLGHPVSVDESMAHFMGLAGQDFLDAIVARIGHPIPQGFAALRAEEDRRAIEEGIEAVAGAADFVRSLPRTLPRAIASSSATRWIEAHLDHLDLRACFGAHIYSGREHVTRGKPAPDLYLHAADALGIDIARCLIIEDSPVGVTGAVASGAHVIGLTAGQHCGPGHGARLLALGVPEVAGSFEELARLIA
ncbi:HAD family hydrolase [Sphingobium boeckii]|uniref:HAD superfamily hydrolase (TIGR01509 family) n=1 Tax=Sphingobium boeckii TaxID=1082345 RepID=A0A7W9EDM0_9SPHN|nr:HAD family phosphatase [Sphingobium boeckii]MBB5684110.1 HAD superfamily hydrolase (TIGR01509 family) [Sphingobium boeckii]